MVSGTNEGIVRYVCMYVHIAEGNIIAYIIKRTNENEYNSSMKQI